MDKNQDNNRQVNNTAKADTSKVLANISANDGFAFVYKKTERLTSALYLISGFFDDKEPLKWRLRSLGADLLSDSLILNENSKGGNEKTITDMREAILEIGGLLSVAKNAGLMSDMNYSIIDEEFSNLMSLVSSGNGRSVLSRNFFTEGLYDNTKHATPKLSSGTGERAQPIQTEQTQISVPQAKPIDKGQTRTNLLDEDALLDIRDKKPQKTKEAGTVTLKKNSRQNIILDIVKNMKEIMIKDVSPLISGCSEKTIQRELLAMVNAGILKKEGEKRWSRYSLASE
jgi:hypothetical protein